MASYVTHQYNADEVFKKLEPRIQIDQDDLRRSAIGPDSLIMSDGKTFKNMHKEHVKEYFEALLKSYKEKKLYNDSEAMAFLYGQLNHYMLDVSIHPLIYYLTEKQPKKFSVGPHGLVEMWIDDYYRKQYGPKKPYKFGNRKIESNELREVIDDVTGKVYGTVNAAKKYDSGVKFVSLYDSLVRKNYLGIVPLVERFKLGPVMYRSNLSRVIPYLNLDHQELRNPETGEIFTESFDDLYQRAIDMSLETIKDVDDYLYLDKPLKNYYIENDISYNSGLSCSLGQTCPYAKEYTDEELYNLAIRVLESNSLNSASKDAIKAGVMIAPLLLSLPLMCKDGELSADLNSLLVSLSGVLLVGTEELVCIIKDMANVSDSSVRKRK